MTRSYSELIELPTIEERYEYLRLRGTTGRETFGLERFVNQRFYRSNEWKDIRREVILRDDGCDLGVSDYGVHHNIHIHHMNPMTSEQIRGGDPAILDPEFLISASLRTHNAIHYGTAKLLPEPYVERRPGDTKLW